jgi:cytochrome c-type biogenesis protein CcmF
MVGNAFIMLALTAGIVSCIMYFLSHKGYKNSLPYARISFRAASVFVIAASAFLLYAIITHRYEYKYVYEYSGSELPVGLLISTFYAGQEGSFLLWTFFSAIIGLILIEYTSKRGDLEPRVMMVFSLILSSLLIMVSPFLKSPFNYVWSSPGFIDFKNINPAYFSLPALRNFIFSDPQSGKQFLQFNKELYEILISNNIPFDKFIIQGKGLNPLLQNFWMQIHPPILFIGFAMAAVPYSFAIAALIKNEYKDWIKHSLPWIISGMMILGLALMLGGYWAYGVLGWGGYWGWDPVENSSLVPWLIGVALIHTMIVQKKTQNDLEENQPGRFVKTNLILCVMMFVLVLYSTFLTRSGVLGDASVHSFVDPGKAVYLFLMIFLGLFTVIGKWLIIYRWKYLSKQISFEEKILSRELAMFGGSFALIASAIIIFVGTSAPIFGQTVETKFYNELNLPIAIIIGLLIGLSILLKWQNTNNKELLKQLQLPTVIAIVLTVTIMFFGKVFDIMLILLTFSSVFALLLNVEIAYKKIKERETQIGSYIAHVGVSVFLIGVMASGNYSEREQIDLAKNEKVKVLGHELTFTGYEPFEDGKKYHFNIEVANDGKIQTAKPVMFFSEFSNSLMREPDILAGLAKDFYIEPISYDEGTSEVRGIEKTLKQGDSFNFEGKEIVFKKYNLPKDMNAMMSGGAFRIGIDLTIKFNGKEIHAEPYMENSGQEQTFIPAEIIEANLKVNILSMNASNAEVILSFSNLEQSLKQAKEPKEILTIEASTKPFISLIWIGTLIIVLGFAVSAIRRSRESTI